MFSRTLLLSIFASTVASQSTTPAVVCVPGQCIQGYSNVSIGASLSKGSEPTLHLLPGEYKSNTDPKLLHDMLTSSSSSLSPSPGFTTSAKLSPLPLNLKLEPGLAIYAGANYSGQGGFTALPTQPIPQNTSTPIPADSLAISENVWVAVSSGSNNNSRVVLWESVPDVAQLGLSSLNLLDLQSTACTPACSSSGICSASGSCVCPPNFSGTSCESCAAGHFGVDCKPCPEGCTECDEGMSGSGQCFSINVGPTDPKTCNCVNGECTSGGTCECNQGWIDGPESKCSACQTGFFLSSTGSCTACQVGCERCDSTTAACASCKTGFRQDDTDRTRCIPIQAVIPGGQGCPVNTFGNQATGRCEPCARECDACSGAGSGSCLTCARGLYMANGQCVSADTNGACAGTNGLVADNIKRVCDACPSKCASCSIPNFDEASNIGELQCTTCTPGSFLSQGRCVDSCPAGTFVNPQDNRSCIPCSSSCATCAGSADFCTACTGTLFASSGQCVQSCPQNTFSITSNTTPPRNSCTPCHPDCSTCSGASFNECLTCSSSRPVLSTTSGSSSGRCLPTCNKNQFFDASSGGCKSCDGSCGSCVGAGTNQCLSCQSPNQVVRDGQCVEANCSNGSSVVPSLGICLSSLVFVPSKSENGDPLPPLPTITGISEPAPKEGKMKLEWWQILLMALGCAFIFVMFLWCWRRRARKQRKARTEQFANGKGLNDKRRFWDLSAWGAGLRRMFGRKNKHAKKQSGELPIAYNHQDVALREMREEWRENKSEGGMNKMSNLKKPSKKSLRNDGREDDDLDSYINAYDYSRRSVAMTVKSHTPSTLPDLDGYRRGNYVAERERLRRQAANAPVYRDMDTDSMYSELTGQQRNTPEPRQALKSDLVMPSFASSRRSPSPPPVWNNNSNKLKKPMVVQKPSSDTLSSVVIAPQPTRQDSSEAILVDLLDSPDSERHYPFKIASPRRVSPPPLLPPVQPLATFASLQQPPRTEAEAYAMANKPALMLSQQQQQPQYTLAWIPTQMTGSSFGNSGPLPVITPNMTGSTTLGGASGGGGGTSYWLNQPPVPVKSDSPTGDNSKNPFRQGPVAF